MGAEFATFRQFFLEGELKLYEAKEGPLFTDESKGRGPCSQMNQREGAPDRPCWEGNGSICILEVVIWKHFFSVLHPKERVFLFTDIYENANFSLSVLHL